MSENESEAVPSSSSASKKERSPNFPFIPLTKAMERVRLIYNAAKRHEARLADLADALNSGAKSSGTIQTVSALISYGLLEDSGSGDARKFKVTDLAFKALEDQRPGARAAALREAAMKPKIIAEYADLWSEGRPSDGISISILRIDGGFTEDGAKTFLRVFDDAISYAPDMVSDKNSAADNGVIGGDQEEKARVEISVGDMVQWETDGVLRLDRPTAVRAIQDHNGERWAFVEGSESGILVSELIIEKKSKDIMGLAPTLPLPVAPSGRKEPEVIQEGIDVDRFTIDEGVVRLEFPKNMGMDSVEELEDFFKLFIRKAKRRATL